MMMWRKRWLRWAVLLLGLAVAAFLVPYERRSWTEDVKLSDGTIVKAHRTSKASRFGGDVGRRGPVVEESVTFDYRGQKMSWAGDTIVLVADVYQGTPFVATDAGFGEIELRYGRPNPPRVFFRRDAGGWQRIAPEEFPNALCPNLFLGAWRNSVNSHYTLADKERIDGIGRMHVQPLKRGGRC